MAFQQKHIKIPTPKPTLLSWDTSSSTGPRDTTLPFHKYVIPDCLKT